MPELPEVQTVVSQLAAKVVGLTVVDFRSEWAKAVRPSLALFRESIIGEKIIGVRRFGKHIVIDMESISEKFTDGEGWKEGVFQQSGGRQFGRGGSARQGKIPSFTTKTQFSIIIHLKMTGHLLVKTTENENAVAFRDDPYNGHIRHVIALSEGTRIEFSDMRKFGWLEVGLTSEVEKLKSIRELGVDALSEKFTAQYFRQVLEKKSKQTIGALLLEQKLIAGIGNIYRNEALFRAKVLPMRRAATLKTPEIRRLHQSIRTVLIEAVALRGMSDGDFRDTSGQMGEFEENAFVYGRENLLCKKCGTIIVRAKLGQRSVFFCPQCQQ
ncbi:MAG: DNA-formamidopyrimidine glycosylase [Candidatus Moraniibacteriota bacterium]